MSDRTALLAGGSGLIGGYCLDYLLNDEYYSRVIALVRQPLALTHPKLVQHQVDFGRLKDSLDGVRVDDVYCCLGATIKRAGSQEAFRKVDFTYPLEIAESTLANGAEQYLLVTALGARSDSVIFYNRVKGDVERCIGASGFKGFYVFQPSLLLGKRQVIRRSEEFWRKFSTRLIPFVFKGRLQKYRPIEAEAVAYAMVHTAKARPCGKQVFESDRIQSIYDRCAVSG